MNKKILHYIQKIIYSTLKFITFKSSHISFGGKISLLGAFICFISLFLSWLSSSSVIVGPGNMDISSFSSFAGVLGRVGFFILFTLIIIVFSIFSIKNKEKIRHLSLINFSDYICSLVGAVLILLLCIQSLFLSQGLQFFSSNIIHGQGIILCITGALVLLSGSIFIRQEYRKNIKGSYINDVKNEQEKMLNIERKDNMKLPF